MDLRNALLGCVPGPFRKVCEPDRAFLSRSCLAPDLAAFDGLLLACWHAARTGRLKVITRQWARMMPRRIKGQQQGRNLAVPAAHPQGDAPEADARGLWDVCTTAPHPKWLVENRPPLPPPPPG